MSQCASCQQTIVGSEYQHGGKSFCFGCLRTRIDPKRIERVNRMREDVLEKNYRQMREAIAQRDKYRREAAAVKDGLRAEVLAEERARLKARLASLGFWARLRVLFNGFGALDASAQRGGG